MAWRRGTHPVLHWHRVEGASSTYRTTRIPGQYYQVHCVLRDKAGNRWVCEWYSPSGEWRSIGVRDTLRAVKKLVEWHNMRWHEQAVKGEPLTPMLLGKGREEQ